MKKTPLRISALSLMMIALGVIALSLSYILGVNILPRIIPGVPEAPQLSTYSYSDSLVSHLILPLLYFSGLLFLLLKSFRDMIAQKQWHGLRSEFALLEFSLIGAAFSLFILSDYMQPAGSINEHLISVSMFLCILAIGTLVGSFLYKRREILL